MSIDGMDIGRVSARAEKSLDPHCYHGFTSIPPMPDSLHATKTWSISNFYCQDWLKFPFL